MITGRRIPDDTFFGPEHDDWLPGDYGLDSGVLWAITPAGDPIRIDDRWGFEIHADGTVTVCPASPGLAHSIRVHGRNEWHGYLTNGAWITCDDSAWQEPIYP